MQQKHAHTYTPLSFPLKGLHTSMSCTRTQQQKGREQDLNCQPYNYRTTRIDTVGISRCRLELEMFLLHSVSGEDATGFATAERYFIHL